MANGISLLRLMLFAVGAGLLATGHRGALPVLLCTTSVVFDAIDGWAARKLGQCSMLGEFVDPLIDKVSVATALVLIGYGIEQLAAWALILLIIARDVGVTGLRSWLLSRRSRLAPDRVAKLKTGAMFVMCMTMLACLYWFDMDVARLETPIVILLALMTLLTGYSAVRYLAGMLAVESRGDRRLPEH